MKLNVLQGIMINSWIRWSVIAVLGIWLLSAWVLLPKTEKALQQQAAALLSAAEHQGAFSEVRAAFSGQEASLTGSVGSEESRDQAEQIIQNKVRIEGGLASRWNPVTDVENLIRVDDSWNDRHPAQWFGLAHYDGKIRLSGILTQADLGAAAVAALKPKMPGLEIADVTLSREGARPALDWDATLKSAPDLQSLTRDGNPQAFAMSACDGKWTLFPVGAKAEEITKLSAQAGVSAQAALTIQSEITQWQEALVLEQKARLAEAEKKAREAAEVVAQKARAEAEAKAKAAAMPPPSAPPAPVSVSIPATPSFYGWTFEGGHLQIFGAVPNADWQSRIIAAAKTAYPNAKISAEGLKIDTARRVPAADTQIQWNAVSDKAAVGMVELGGSSKTYSFDVFDSEIAKDFPAIPFRENELTQALQTFRQTLVTSKVLTQDEPYISVLTDGKTLNISGEVADEASKNSVLEALKKANPELTLNDGLNVTPLVTATADLAATLQSAPTFAVGKSGIAVVTPGQKWRTAVVHSIHFKTGSNRSKDQERALYQVRRVLKLNPAAQFEIAGHTDNVGAVDANIKLSQDRANNVADGLAQNGIDRSILSTRGVGPNEPVADSGTEAGRAQNRRVDVLLK